ncbi:hypothetical protein MKW94_010095 [Papaver nudicaule]|uniref:F-box protein n=1 Tax=Papaver nudicaule TaxID=74823 RepID=A0AA41SM61_PAPNU|nr:hypothetical protein [Papaver nudicaule]
MPPYRHLLHSKDIAKLVYFGECRGRLHLISDYDRLSIFDILEMKTDYKGWIPKLRIDVRRCFPYPVVYGGYCVLHVEEVGDSIRLVVRIQEQAISCDLPDLSFLPEFAPWLPKSSFKDLYEFAPGTWKKISYNRSHQYIETLASV